MRKIAILFLFLIFTLTTAKGQIICIFCYNQNDSISSNVNNLLLNGSFENSNCTPGYTIEMFCPNSIFYSCDVNNWTCTGGGSSTYACVFDSLPSSRATLVDGIRAVYLGNSLANPCSAIPEDTSCLVMTNCEISGISAGYPVNDQTFGGTTGVSIEQTVNGMIPGDVYILEFWAGGESNGTTFSNPGMFGIDVGFGNTLLRCHETPYTTGVGTRYIIEFRATSVSHTVKFTNWGHICPTCTEVVLDQVRLYSVAELSSSVTPCSAGVSAIFTSPNHICPGTCTDFTNHSTNATTYLWNFSGGNPSLSTDVNPSGICYNTPGSYSVQLIAGNANSSDTLLLPNYITVYPYPLPQGITQSGDTLFANAGANSYQWYLGGNIISGATHYFYVAPVSGDYNVVASDGNGCELEAVLSGVVADMTLPAKIQQSLVLVPNPVVDEITILNPEIYADGIIKVTVFNIVGEIFIPEFDRKRMSVDCSHLLSGVYGIEIISADKIFNGSFIKIN